jgi:hypothetical protein
MAKLPNVKIGRDPEADRAKIVITAKVDSEDWEAFKRLSPQHTGLTASAHIDAYVRRCVRLWTRKK